MALIMCPECGTQISDKARFCPKCAFDLSQYDASTVQMGNEETKIDKYSPDINDDQGTKNVELASVSYNSRNTSNSNNTNSQTKFSIKGLWYTELMLFIIAAGIVYLVIGQFRQNNNSSILDSSNRLLIVEVDNSLDEDKISDSTQISNALSNGGMMRINMNNMDYSLESKIEEYAALNSKHNYWVLGALLNYISSEGWTFVQAPTSGITDTYYFIR